MTTNGVLVGSASKGLQVRKVRSARRWRWSVILLGVMLALAAGVILNRTFLPPGDAAAEDGFQAQISYVVMRWQDETLFEVGEDWLVWVHVFRLLAAGPFILMEMSVGPAGSLAMLLLVLWPLVRRTCGATRDWIAVLPFLLPLAVSGRSVLVAAGVGYVISYLIQPKGRRSLLWVGVLFANLSSAAVLTCTLLLVLVRLKGATGSMQRWLALSVLLLSLGISLADKLLGFQSGDVGYEAHAFATDNLLLVILSRSTLLVSLIDGQYLRAAAYVAITVYLVYKLAGLLRDPRSVLGRRVLLCCLPGVLMEGLGVLAMFFPLFWLLTGAFTENKRSASAPVGRRINAATGAV